jgi:hypothetical protein
MNLWLGFLYHRERLIFMIFSLFLFVCFGLSPLRCLGVLGEVSPSQGAASIWIWGAKLGKN